MESNNLLERITIIGEIPEWFEGISPYYVKEL